MGDDLKLDMNTELAARRTGMAFQRTRLAEDRTLMAVIRTALSLIGFGFTIFQFFQRLARPSAPAGVDARGWMIHGETAFPVSLTLVTALLLLAIGVAAIASMQFDVGLFG